MEKPYTGRATIHDLYNSVEIIIPAKKNWLIILHCCFLSLFGLVFLFVVPQSFRNTSPNDVPAGIMLLFMLVPLLMVLFAGSTLWWMFAGKEIATFSQGLLTIERKGAIAKTKSYDLNEANNFRVGETFSDFGFIAFPRLMYAPWTMSKTGTIKFDYGLGTVKFGDRLSEAEGNYILERLRNKKLIS